MADAASDDPVRTENDGITVEKSFEPDDFPVPAIAFTIRSERDEPVSIRLTDTVPDDIPTEDIGFHPKYGAEFWDVEGNTIAFSREFEPHEEFVTVYGLRGKDATDVDRFLTEPELDSVDPIEGDSGDVVRDVISEEPVETANGPDGLAGDAAGSDAPASDEEADEATDLDLDLPEPGEADRDEGAGADDSAPPSRDVEASPPAAMASDGSLAAALAEEIRTGDVPEEDLENLREALGVTAEDTTDARIEHLQSAVADLEAYIEALEEFLDEEGDAQSVIRDVREDFETTSERIDDLEVDLEELWTEVDEEIDEQLTDVREEVEAVESEVASATRERIETLEDDVAALEEELANVAEMRDRLATALGGLTVSDGDAAGSDGDEAADED